MAITKVTTDVITDLAVTAPKLAADSVITAKIADNAVTAAKIAAGALTDQVAGISSAADATAITIDSSENVGIGGSPGAKLDVNSGTTNTIAHFHTTDDNGFIELKDDDTTAYIGVQDDYVYIGGAPSLNAQNLVINDGDGKVGIGTTSPTQLLHLDNSASSSDSAGIRIISGTAGLARILLGDTGYGARGRITYDNSDDSLQLWGADSTTSGERMRITSAGNVGIGTDSPDQLLQVGSESYGANAIIKTQVDGSDVGDFDSGLHMRSHDDNFGGSIVLESRSGTNDIINFKYHNNSSAGATAMAIDATNGKVGIGITGPTAYLDVRAPSGVSNPNVAYFKSDQHGLGVYVNIGSSQSEIRSNNNSYPLVLNASSGGNVGIGTTGPDSKLDIESNHSQLRLTDSDDSKFVLFSYSGGKLITRNNSTDTTANQFTLTEDGKLGIGTIHPAGTLHVQMTHTSTDVTAANSNETLVLGNSGTGNGVYNAIKFAGNQQDMYIMSFNDNTQADRRLGFFVGSVAGDAVGDERLSITGNGDVGIGTTSPASISGAAGNILEIAGSNPEIVFSDTSGTANSMSMYYLNGALYWWNGSANNMYLTNAGALTITGSLSKGSGSFRIDHPLEAKKDTHQLVHSFIEGPQADLIYRGKVELVDGSATVNIDTVAGMTEGTFVALNTDVQCFTSNETDWDAVKGSVSGNTLTITCQNSSSTATVSWLVIGERHDQHMIDTEWTDDNGKVIVEPLLEEA